MKQVLIFLLCVLTVLPLVSCGNTPPAVTDPVTDAPETEAPINEPASVTVANKYIEGIDAQVASILATPTTVTYTGTAYYVAADGDDTADGLTPETAWATVARVNEAELAPGDAILFKRGDEFRTADMVYTRKGVTYSAYGEGDKPIINCSADATDWTCWEGTEWVNVYKCTIPFDKYHDVGNILFNGGEAWGIKVQIKRNGDRVENGHVFNGIEHFDSATGKATRYGGLSNNLEFYHNHASGTLYLYCDKGLPDEVFESIEICDRGHGFGGEGIDVVIDNIAVYGTGSFGVGYDQNGSIYWGFYDQAIDVTVQNRAFYYTGGSVFVDYDPPNELDYPVPYTEVVECLDASAAEVKVLNCTATLISKQCAADCIGKEDPVTTLIGTTTSFKQAGFTAENMGNTKLTDQNTQLYADSFGYATAHGKVLIAAEKSEDIIHLHADDRRQTVEGFGACLRYDDANSLYDSDEMLREQVIRSLYDIENGIGLSSFRLGVSLDGPEFNPAPGEYYEERETNILHFLERAYAYNPEISIMACPWSPPSWMKTNGKLGGLTEILPKLKPEYYDDFAEYLITYVKFFENRGFDIDWLSVQNEPTANVSYACCLYTPEELMDVARIVTEHFRKAGLDTVICISDAADPNAQYNTLRELEATDPAFLSAELPAITLHGYQYNRSTLDTTQAEKYGLPLFQTERSTTVAAPRHATNQMLLRTGNELVDYLNHDYSGWYFWVLCGRRDWLGTDEEEAMRNTGAYDGCFLLYYSDTTDVIDYSKEYYALGQFSKFIRPGQVRIGANSLNGNLMVTATVDPDTGKIVTVVVNNGITDITATVDGLSAATAQLWRSSEGEDLVNVGSVDIIDGVATVTFKAQTITTVIEE